MIFDPLTVSGELDAVMQLMDYVAWAAAAAGVGEQAMYKLSLAVDEIATNIVTYSYLKAGREGQLTIEADANDERLWISLTDEGAPFDPRQAPPPADLHQPLHERREGGLGIFLAMWGVDDFDYDSREGVNRSTFIVKLPATT